MEALTDLTITINVNTAAARREVDDFKSYALQAVEEIRAAYASLGPVPGGSSDASTDGVFSFGSQTDGRV